MTERSFPTGEVGCAICPWSGWGDSRGVRRREMVVCMFCPRYVAWRGAPPAEVTAAAYETDLAESEQFAARWGAERGEG